MDNTVSGRQIKAARAILGWTREVLAARAGVTAATVKIVETDDTGLSALAPTRNQLVDVLEGERIVFLASPAPGVQLVPAEDGLRPDELNASNDD
ncbi:helix-turn-helix domain-containing protein [Xanthobacter agilis]|jgi:transcriptional regulator with XRE-family HTH domain|uniref:Transcriptional regulator with XRE-family HTH domain n=1 Tax=Xanthobacter agilis TaxID=47492 RepID=A0ABU0LBQ9_XANAG|nr:helix-turn-helix transcriptional regulator [Xanthobacter agilis]MDQ0504536.1 transcriptional regulator with XRE-family HTH domain [Xanthobacter agilis]